MSRTESRERRPANKTHRHDPGWHVSRSARLGIILAVAAAACSPPPDTSDPVEQTSNDVQIDAKRPAKCVGGPKFDPAGTKNVGNGKGRQFIGGQCRNAKDCASGCCALPCGICSGPGAQFQAGKKGCGFGGKKAAFEEALLSPEVADLTPSTEGGGQESGAFPALLDLTPFQLDLAGNGGPGSSGGSFDVVNAVARDGIDELQRLVDSSKVTIEKDAQGRSVEVRSAQAAGLTFQSRQTFAGGIQEGLVVVNGVKRLQFSRNQATGAFEGVLIPSGSDRGAPIAAIVTPRGDGTSSHLIVEDGNNLRGELLVDSRTLVPIKFLFFHQFQGGLAAQPESAALVRKLGFDTIIPGF
ncbi:MAG TPA: hypothetical protein VGP87_06725 [Gemmatimonadales bacterium]|nr:hypothetical protein [Gemmatimonadales bacterium]